MAADAEVIRRAEVDVRNLTLMDLARAGNGRDAELGDMERLMALTLLRRRIRDGEQASNEVLEELLDGVEAWNASERVGRQLGLVLAMSAVGLGRVDDVLDKCVGWRYDVAVWVLRGLADAAQGGFRKLFDACMVIAEGTDENRVGLSVSVALLEVCSAEMDVEGRSAGVRMGVGWVEGMIAAEEVSLVGDASYVLELCADLLPRVSEEALGVVAEACAGILGPGSRAATALRQAACRVLVSLEECVPAWTEGVCALVGGTVLQGALELLGHARLGPGNASLTVCRGLNSSALTEEEFAEAEEPQVDEAEFGGVWELVADHETVLGLPGLVGDEAISALIALGGLGWSAVADEVRGVYAEWPTAATVAAAAAVVNEEEMATEVAEWAVSVLPEATDAGKVLACFALRHVTHLLPSDAGLDAGPVVDLLEAERPSVRIAASFALTAVARAAVELDAVRKLAYTWETRSSLERRAAAAGVAALALTGDDDAQAALEVVLEDGNTMEVVCALEALATMGALYPSEAMADVVQGSRVVERATALAQGSDLVPAECGLRTLAVAAPLLPPAYNGGDDAVLIPMLEAALGHLSAHVEVREDDDGEIVLEQKSNAVKCARQAMVVVMTVGSRLVIPDDLAAALLDKLCDAALKLDTEAAILCVEAIAALAGTPSVARRALNSILETWEHDPNLSVVTAAVDSLSNSAASRPLLQTRDLHDRISTILLAVLHRKLAVQEEQPDIPLHSLIPANIGPILNAAVLEPLFADLSHAMESVIPDIAEKNPHVLLPPLRDSLFEQLLAFATTEDPADRNNICFSLGVLLPRLEDDLPFLQTAIPRAIRALFLSLETSQAQDSESYGVSMAIDNVAAAIARLVALGARNEHLRRAIQQPLQDALERIRPLLPLKTDMDELAPLADNLESIHRNLPTPWIPEAVEAIRHAHEHHAANDAWDGDDDDV